MRKETDLFENFIDLTKAPQEEIEHTTQLIKVLTQEACREDGNSMVQLCKSFRHSLFHEPLSASEIDSLVSSHCQDDKRKAMELLQKIGRIQILDITQEISLLREIKDIQDELNIISMLFEDQRKVLKTMDSIFRSLGTIETKLQAIPQEGEDPVQEKSEENTTISGLEMKPVKEDREKWKGDQQEMSQGRVEGMPRDESEETKYDAVTVETENVRNGKLTRANGRTGSGEPAAIQRIPGHRL